MNTEPETVGDAIDDLIRDNRSLQTEAMGLTNIDHEFVERLQRVTTESIAAFEIVRGVTPTTDLHTVLLSPKEVAALMSLAAASRERALQIMRREMSNEDEMRLRRLLGAIEDRLRRLLAADMKRGDAL